MTLDNLIVERRSRLSIFRWFIVFIFILAGPASVSAAELTGRQLLFNCDSKKTSYLRGVCEGYVVGYINAYKKIEILNDLSWTMLNEALRTAVLPAR
jgi:hypothetical protein